MALANVLLHASSPHTPPSMEELRALSGGSDPKETDGGGLPLSAVISWAATRKPVLTLVHSASEEARQESTGRVLGYLEHVPTHDGRGHFRALCRREGKGWLRIDRREDPVVVVTDAEAGKPTPSKWVLAEPLRFQEPAQSGRSRNRSRSPERPRSRAGPGRRARSADGRGRNREKGAGRGTWAALVEGGPMWAAALRSIPAEPARTGGTEAGVKQAAPQEGETLTGMKRAAEGEVGGRKEPRGEPTTPPGREEFGEKFLGPPGVGDRTQPRRDAWRKGEPGDGTTPPRGRPGETTWRKTMRGLWEKMTSPSKPPQELAGGAAPVCLMERMQDETPGRAERFAGLEAGEEVWYCVSSAGGTKTAQEEGLAPGWHPAVVEKAGKVEATICVAGRVTLRCRTTRLVRKREAGQEPPGTPALTPSQAGNGGGGDGEDLSPL